MQHPPAEAVHAALIELARTDLNQGFDQQTALNFLYRKFPENIVDIHLLAQTLSQLCQHGRLLAFQAGSKYRWKLENDERYEKLRGLSQTDRIVYEVIERSQNQGIWIKDLRKRTNLIGTNDLDKSLKFLVARKLIKSEESISGKNKKVYMLYELTPAVEVTGGVWYTQKTKDIDTQFALNMRRAVSVVLQKKGPMSNEQLAQYLKERGVAKIKLSPQDIRMLCQTMLYDGLIDYAPYQDMHEQSSRIKYAQQYLAPMEHEDEKEDPDPIYALNTVDDIEAIDFSAFSSPCMACPLQDKCGSGRVIEPETCQYFQEWINDKTDADPTEWVQGYMGEITRGPTVASGVATPANTTTTTSQSTMQ